jgi:hypothetical protein
MNGLLLRLARLPKQEISRSAPRAIILAQVLATRRLKLLMPQLRRVGL